MKKKIQEIVLAIITIVPLLAEAQPAIRPGKNFDNIRTATSANGVRLQLANPTDVFSTSFSANASGKNDANAYLLCYLSTLIYPDYFAQLKGRKNDRAYIDSLHARGSVFEEAFKAEIRKYFTSPSIKFIQKSDRLGYDPEAMVIADAKSVYVVFRGTDRVAANKQGFAYDWAEWIFTDFDGRLIETPYHEGKVLAGMWGSLEYDGFKEDLYDEIIAKGGSTKKIWITGHSLGAGQAQLFAMYLAKRNVQIQGLYGFAAPNPGNQQFADAMDRIFPNQRFQRFDFAGDPITVLAQAVGCVPAGTRVHYKDIVTTVYNEKERSLSELALLIPSVVGVIANGVADFVNANSTRRLQLDALVLGNSNFCYHHPTWYLKSAHNQLSETEKSQMPSPLALPTENDEACDRYTVRSGENAATPIDQPLRDLTVSILNNISVIAGTLAGNISGSVLPTGEGTYKITCLQGGKSLATWGRCKNENGCPIVLWNDDGGSNMRFEVFKYGAGFGLKIKGSSNNEVLDVKDLSVQNGTRLHTWSKHIGPVLPNNQIWYLHNVGPNQYVLQNERSGKVLDADAPNTANNGCEVMQWQYRKDAKNQVWVFEKTN
jgi:pimeloyl-ACP methyl ester carboxylesterase